MICSVYKRVRSRNLSHMKHTWWSFGAMSNVCEDKTLVCKPVVRKHEERKIQSLKNERGLSSVWVSEPNYFGARPHLFLLCPYLNRVLLSYCCQCSAFCWMAQYYIACRITFVLAVYSRRGQIPFLLLRSNTFVQFDVDIWFSASKIGKKVLNPLKEVVQTNLDCQLLPCPSIW
jgi:hypothetical protein